MLVLLAAKPGPLRDGLDALLDSIPEVNLVAHANDVDAARSFFQHHPTQLMILDMKPGDGSMLSIASELKALCPKSQVMILIHEEEDRLAAEAAGADMVLVTGTHPTKIKEVIKEAAIALVDE